jgi:hypothetical protein
VSTKFKARGGQFSPDGNWMAYSSSESGREEVYVQAFPRGPRFTVTASGGKEPAWRRDGHELYYVAGDGMLTTVPVTFKNTSIEFGPPQRLFPAPLGQFRRNYEVSRDGKRFLIATPANPGGDAITVVLNWQAALKF